MSNYNIMSKKGYKQSEEHKKKISLSLLGKHLSLFTKEKIRNANLGKKQSSETKEKMSLAHKGKLKSLEHSKNISLGRKGIIFSEKHRKHISESCKGRNSWNKGKRHLAIIGEKHPNWKGGITPINKIIRHSIEYKLWVRAVFERDNYTCIWCGRKGNQLNADHIQEFSLYPELRFCIDNGRTLCKECHKKRHKKSVGNLIK